MKLTAEGETPAPDGRVPRPAARCRAEDVRVLRAVTERLPAGGRRRSRRTALRGPRGARRSAHRGRRILGASTTCGIGSLRCCHRHPSGVAVSRGGRVLPTGRGSRVRRVRCGPVAPGGTSGRTPRAAREPQPGLQPDPFPSADPSPRASPTAPSDSASAGRPSAESRRHHPLKLGELPGVFAKGRAHGGNPRPRLVRTTRRTGRNRSCGVHPMWSPRGSGRGRDDSYREAVHAVKRSVRFPSFGASRVNRRDGEPG